VVLVGTVGLDRVPDPGRAGVEPRRRVLPPPEGVALPVGAEDQVEVAVAINVVRGPAGLDRQEGRLDHDAVPPRRLAAVPDESRWLLAEAQDEVVTAVAIEVCHQRGGLLLRRPGHGQLALFAGEMLPDKVAGERRGATDQPDRQGQNPAHRSARPVAAPSSGASGRPVTARSLAAGSPARKHPPAKRNNEPQQGQESSS
jgi:hypothetical protein